MIPSCEFLQNPSFALVLGFLLRNVDVNSIASKSHLTNAEVLKVVNLFKEKNILDAHQNLITESLSSDLLSLFPDLAEKAFIQMRCERTQIDVKGRLDWIDGMAEMIAHGKK